MATSQKEDGPGLIKALGERLGTWGDFGPDDEKGAANLITDQHRVRAAGLVRRGKVFSLALQIRDRQGPMGSNAIGRFNPMHHMTKTGFESGPIEMGADSDFTDDMLVIGCHSTTHWDALSHVYYDGKIYNGASAEEVDQTGTPHSDIDAVHDDLVGRGVLLDLARHLGVDELEPGYAVSPEELTACAEKQGVAVGEGDIMLVRTGVLNRVDGDDWSGFHGAPRPGLHYTTVEWMKDRGVAAAAADNNGVEAPSTLDGVRNPLHMLALRDVGIYLGEFWDLEELAADCAADGVYEFLLAAQPLRIDGGVGSPINPLAIK
jgi:kynurenine formamidase